MCGERCLDSVRDRTIHVIANDEEWTRVRINTDEGDFSRRYLKRLMDEIEYHVKILLITEKNGVLHKHSVEDICLQSELEALAKKIGTIAAFVDYRDAHHKK